MQREMATPRSMGSAELLKARDRDRDGELFVDSEELCAEGSTGKRAKTTVGLERTKAESNVRLLLQKYKDLQEHI